jgi:hypothetical protein
VAGSGRREKEAFEKLIHEKKHMVMPAEVFERTSADDKFAALVADSVGETDPVSSSFFVCHMRISRGQIDMLSFNVAWRHPLYVPLPQACP